MSDVDNNKRILTVKPTGWANFEYRDICRTGISYICNPHTDIAEGLAKVLSEDDESSFVLFDYEGTEELLAITPYGLTLISPKNAQHVPMSNREMIQFAERFADELEADIDDWVASWTGLDDEEYTIEAKEDLQDLIDALRAEIIYAKSISFR